MVVVPAVVGPFIFTIASFERLCKKARPPWPPVAEEAASADNIFIVKVTGTKYVTVLILSIRPLNMHVRLTRTLSYTTMIITASIL